MTHAHGIKSPTEVDGAGDADRRSGPAAARAPVSCREALLPGVSGSSSSRAQALLLHPARGRGMCVVPCVFYPG